MIQSLYTGASGLTGQQKNIDVIANNVSNLNTDGFVRSRFDFQDCLYLRMRAPKPASNGPEKNLMRGSGAIAYQTALILQQGPLRETGRVLDFALEGRGFFAVENPLLDEEYEGNADRSILLVRGGNFHLSVEEESAYLVDEMGRYILNENSQRIELPAGVPVEGIVCSAEGQLSYTPPLGGETVEIARLMLLDFVNPAGLERVGHGAFVQSDNSGDIINADAAVLQRMLESSNVDYSEEVTRLIRAQRAYQIASRVVTTADQMMGIANNIRQ
ncbi:MAG: flagellar hook-basal body protein [Oscillospiraceae bacterium]|nr:flagellar hook-basal body protein [Oscillospiraceae bacterium]